MWREMIKGKRLKDPEKERARARERMLFSLKIQSLARSHADPRRIPERTWLSPSREMEERERTVFVAWLRGRRKMPERGRERKQVLLIFPPFPPQPLHAIFGRHRSSFLLWPSAEILARTRERRLYVRRNVLISPVFGGCVRGSLVNFVVLGYLGITGAKGPLIFHPRELFRSVWLRVCRRRLIYSR